MRAVGRFTVFALEFDFIKIGGNLAREARLGQTGFLDGCSCESIVGKFYKCAMDNFPPYENIILNQRYRCYGINIALAYEIT